MVFWQSSALLNLLMVGVLLLVAAGIRRVVSRWRRTVMPDSMLAGVFGLLMGPSLLGWLPLDTDFLEMVVYHALAIVFIAVGLQTPVSGAAKGNARSMAIGIPLIALLQGVVGLTFVLVWSAYQGQPLYPGYGLMLPLAFSQGPGQALSLGTSWESMGMPNGGQIGLIMAAIGFAWCTFVGVPLISWARRRGWDADPGRAGAAVAEETQRPEPPVLGQPPAGGMEALTLQVASILAIYLLVFLLLTGGARLLAGRDQLVALLFGFHFIIAGVLALALRRGVAASGIRHRLNDALLGRIAGTTIDFATCSALAAIQIKVLQANWAPILVTSTVAGLLTLVFVIWLARRAFPTYPFEHAVVLFGTSTGTLPTGLALLRVLDPELRGPVATSAMLGATAAILLGAPLLLVVIPVALANWPASHPTQVLIALGLMLAYGGLLVLAWRYLGPLRYLRPLNHLWPLDDDGKSL